MVLLLPLSLPSSWWSSWFSSSFRSMPDSTFSSLAVPLFVVSFASYPLSVYTVWSHIGSWGRVEESCSRNSRDSSRTSASAALPDVRVYYYSVHQNPLHIRSQRQITSSYNQTTTKRSEFFGNSCPVLLYLLHNCNLLIIIIIIFITIIWSIHLVFLSCPPDKIYYFKSTRHLVICSSNSIV